MDRLFKMGLLIIGVAFVYVYYLHLDVHRYKLLEDGVAVIDTQTGKLFVVGGGGSLVVDFTNAKVTKRAVQHLSGSLESGTDLPKPNIFDQFDKTNSPKGGAS